MSHQKITDAFNGSEDEPRIFTRPPRTTSLVPSSKEDFALAISENKKQDYVSVRDNIKNLIAEVEMVVSDVVDEVRSRPNARLVETFSLLVKTFADLNKDLLEINGKSTAGIGEPIPSQTPVNNVVFVGTSESLIDRLKSNLRTDHCK